MDVEKLESILKTLFWIGAAISAAGMLVQWIRLERRIRKNNRENIQTCEAVAYYKDPNAGYLPQGNASSSVYYITFHTDDGEIVTLDMGSLDYFSIEEGTRGMLTWQGRKFWRFEQCV